MNNREKIALMLIDGKDYKTIIERIRNSAVVIKNYSGVKACIFIIISFIIFLPLISANPDLNIGLHNFYTCDASSGSNLQNDYNGLTNFTMAGTYSWVPGKIGNALKFNGNTAYGSATGLLIPADTDYTISIWVNATDLGANYDGIISARTLAVAGWAIQRFTGNNYFIWAWGGVYYNFPSTAVNQWHNYVVRRKGSNQTLWYDGTFTGNWSTVSNSGAGNLTANVIGRYYTDYNGHYFTGEADLFGIWWAALSDEDIVINYNAGAGRNWPFVVSTCTCPSINTNWNISMADYCNITSACNLGTGKMSFYGSGYCSVNSTVTTTNLGEPGANGLLKILSNALIWVKG